MSDIDRRQLRKESVGTAHIVFFVVAAAAPLTAVLGASPAAFAFGNGPGVPAVYILVGLLYLLFSAGFTAMSRYVQSASGFYAYVVSGLGRPAGAVVAAVALTSYQAIALGAYGLFGFFASQSAARAGFHLSWWLAVLPLLAFVQFCGQRAVTFGGNILGVCMMGEIAILVALCCAILAVNTDAPCGDCAAGVDFWPWPWYRHRLRRRVLHRLRGHRYFRRGGQGACADHSAGDLYRGYPHRDLLWAVHVVGLNLLRCREDLGRRRTRSGKSVFATDQRTAGTAGAGDHTGAAPH